MPKLTWRVSYETLRFNTPDGDLHKNQYAIDQATGTTYIRNRLENNGQFIILDPDNKMTVGQKQGLLAPLTEVQIVPNEHEYYDEYIMPGGRIYREKSTEKDYKDLGKKNAGPRADKEVTEEEIIKIKEKDQEL